MDSTTDTRRPRLLKARVRHTRWMAIGLTGVIVLSHPMWNTEGWTHEIVEWIGYAALILCVLGRAWCSIYIGGRKTDELVSEGPYSLVRNPLYVFSFIGVTGIGILTGMITIMIVLIALFAVYYRAVVHREEAVLEENFGGRYRAYRARVPGWIPRFALWRAGPDITVNPRFLLYTMRDSAWFFIAFPALELVEFFQQSGVIPIVLRLP